jgi:hypothetical protein
MENCDHRIVPLGDPEHRTNFSYCLLCGKMYLRHSDGLLEEVKSYIVKNSSFYDMRGRSVLAKLSTHASED